MVVAKKNKVIAPVRKTKTVEKQVEEIKEEEVINEEEVEDETEEEEVVEDETEVGTEAIFHYKKNKGGFLWLTKKKKVGSEEPFWWPKEGIPKSFSDVVSLVEDTIIKSHRDFLGKGVFDIEEVTGGWVIVNTELDKEVSAKLSKKDASRICNELNA